MRWKRLANQRKKERDIPKITKVHFDVYITYERDFLPEIIHVYYLYFSYLTRVFLSCLMPGPLTSTPVGKGRDFHDISIISTGSREK